MSADLAVRGLRVVSAGRTILDDVSLDLCTGEIVALVGASGSGKSLCARALLGLLPRGVTRAGGSVTLTLDGARRELATEREFVALRGGVLGLLFQDARAALDPLWTVGKQVSEAARLAGSPLDPLPWLLRAGFAEPASVARRYPHELSGGMAQRAAIAIGLARQSRILLADEPTTGLDPSVQRGILTQLRSLAHNGTGVLFITHDLRLLPGFADRILVMGGGRIAEEAAEVEALRGPGRALVEATRKVAGGVL